MEIQSYISNKNIIQETSEVKKTNSLTLNEFKANFHPNSMANIDTTVLDEVSKKISTMSYEEVKQYKPQIDEYLKQTGFTDDAPLSNLTFWILLGFKLLTLQKMKVLIKLYLMV